MRPGTKTNRASQRARALWRALVLAVLVLARPAAALEGIRTPGPFASKDARQVLEEWKARCAGTPQDAEAHLSAAWLLEDLGRTQEALAHYQKAAELLPRDAAVLAAWGRAAFDLGDDETAQAALRGALESNPHDPEALRALGELELEQGRPAEASELFRRLADATDGSAHAGFLLGRALEELGETEEAAHVLQKAAKADPQYVEIRAWLAHALAAVQRHDDAWVQYAKVADFDPAFAGASAQKKSLEGLLSKPKEELRPAGKLAGHTRVEPAQNPEGLPALKVGLSANMKGTPSFHRRLTLRAGVPFSVADRATGKTVLSGAAEGPWTFEIRGSSRTVLVSGPAGRKAVRAPAGLQVRLQGPGTFIVEELAFGKGTSWAGRADRELRGSLELRWDAGGRGLFLVNALNLEEYLYGVLASEMPAHWPLEALKAQAVIARTEALFRKAAGPHRKLGFDLCDEQHCQAYGGVKSETPKTRQAVDATRGEVLKHQGKTAHTVYFSNCGGHTQSGSDIHWGNEPYWRGVPDTVDDAFPASPWAFRRWLLRPSGAYCEPGRWSKACHFRWTRTALIKDVERRLNRRYRVGKILNVAVLSRGPAGRALKVEIKGDRGRALLRKEGEIRRFFGLASLRSTLFAVESRRREGRLVSLTFHGAGWGHGVGLCQSGAAGRAQDGALYGDILSHYYPGTDLGEVYGKE